MNHIPFAKYSACGNNFIIIDETRMPLLSESEKPCCASQVTNGYFGVGADGLIFLQANTPDQMERINRHFRYWRSPPSIPDVQFIFRLFEPNGQESFSCGNGLLCAAKHLYLTNGVNRAAFLTELPTAAPRTARVGMDDGRAWVDMGQARRVPTEVAAAEVREPYADGVDWVKNLEIPLRFGGGGQWSGMEARLLLSGYLTFTGEPHLVVFPDRDLSISSLADTLFAPVVDETIDTVSFGSWLLYRIGKWLNREYRAVFPEGININFVRVVDMTDDVLEYRCFERGIEQETLSCGTGAVAIVCVARQMGLIRGESIEVRPYRCRWYLPDSYMRIRDGKTGWTLHGVPMSLCQGRFQFDKMSAINAAAGSYVARGGRRSSAFSVRSAFDLVKMRFPVVEKTISADGDTPLALYFRRFMAPNDADICQPRSDLIELLGQKARDLLGDAIARRAMADLAAHPVVLTAAHHGVDYFSSSVHASLIYSLGTEVGQGGRSTVPVLSFGNVPLNNATFPRGMLIYRVTPAALGRMPLKLPIFPSQHNRKMVSRAPAFDSAMIRTAQDRSRKMVAQGLIPPVIGETIQRLLDECYLDPAALDQPDYARQAVVLNHRIGKRLFARSDDAPDMIWLDQESLVSELLLRDLANPESLAHRVIFTPGIRRRVLDCLDGVRGCWRRHGGGEAGANGKDARTGTQFFWGADDEGRRVPLALRDADSRLPVLEGVNDRGALWRIPLTQEGTIEGLTRGTLLPSLFTCFMEVAFARGMACVGGYFQCEYLPLMKNGLAAALAAEGAAEMARRVMATPADYYMGHAVAVMSLIDHHGLVPAGPLEVIAAGGLHREDRAALGRLTVRQAHLAALFEGVADVVPAGSRPENWTATLARDCHVLLNEKILIK